MKIEKGRGLWAKPADVAVKPAGEGILGQSYAVGPETFTI